MRKIVAAAIILLIAAGVLGWTGYRNAAADPVVRRATLALTDWPTGAAPVTVALIGDIHIGNVQMDEARLARIGAQVSALHPDLIVLAGDFVAGHDAATARANSAALTAGLRHFRAPMGLLAVPGNHDHWSDIAAVRGALSAAGVRVLANDAAAIGPLAIAGLDDLSSGHLKLWPAIKAQARLPGAHVLVSHSPDITPWLARFGHTMPVLAAHTHCGQVVLPVVGVIAGASSYGTRYLCGVKREGGRTIVITAGVGTSIVPLRFGAPPDVWLLTLGPSPAGRRRGAAGA